MDELFITKALREQVQSFLVYMDRTVAQMVELSGQDEWETRFLNTLAAERGLYVSVESVTDVAAIVIDALVMRDPGNYEDMLRVLQEEAVVSREWLNAFVPVLSLRHRLVRDYVHLTPAEVREGVRQFVPLFTEFAASIRNYLGISPL